MSHGKGILKSTGIIGSLTLLSRVLGLIRDRILAGFMGTGFIADAFIWAFTIPNLVRRLFGEGALSAAFIPVFVETKEKLGDEKAKELAGVVFTILTIFLIALTVIGYAIIYIIRQTAGPDETKLIITTTLLNIMLPFLIFICATAILGGLLNSLKHFSAPAMAPVVFNLTLIVAGLCVSGTGEMIIVAFVLSWAVLISGILQIAIQLPALKKEGYSFRLKLDFVHEGFRKVAKSVVPIIFGLAIFQVNVLVDSILAETFARDGAVSVLYYSNRLMQFPLGVFSIAMATAIFPTVSSLAAKGDKNEMSKTVNMAFRMIIFITIPATVGMIVLREPVISAIFKTGKFGADSVARTMMALFLLVIGLVAYSGLQIVTRVFYAHQDTKTPVRIGVWAVVFNFCLNLLLLSLFPKLEESALCLATSITAFLNLSIMVYLLSKKIGEIDFKPIIQTFIKCALASTIMGLVCWLIKTYTIPLDSFTNNLLILLMGITSGIIIYLLFSKIFKARELPETASAFGLKRFFKKS